MPRKGEGERALLTTADRFQPRVARALVTAADRLRSRLPVDELVAAVAAGDVRVATAVVARIDVEDALQPSGEILRDAFNAGGKVEAEELVRRKTLKDYVKNQGW